MARMSWSSTQSSMKGRQSERSICGPSTILSRLLGYAVLLSAIAAGSVAFAYYVFDRLQARVTAPLTKITEVAHEVVTSRNWSLRAPETDYRDFKILVDAFNDMLAECGNRTSELERQMGIREKAEQDLRAADSRKDEFLATLAHELRNPLAPMSNAVSLMERADLSPDARARALLILGRQVRHMVRLIDDLLDASRIATGKLSLVRRPTDLARLVQAAVELAEPSAIDKELKLSFAMPGQTMLVDGDSDRLSQVFSNLLNNACRYTPRGGTIDVTVRQDGATVEVAVRDSGIGIAPDLQESIFELFEQADKTLERGPAGLGIGLTLARQLIELHGGAISVTSEGLGHGSTFAVRLPLLDAVDEILPTTAVTNPAPAGLDILIADDNVDLAESFAAYCEPKAIASRSRSTAKLPFSLRKRMSPTSHSWTSACRRRTAMRSHDRFVREAPRGAYTSSPSRGGGNRPTRRKPPRPDSTCISSNRSSLTSCSACWRAYYGGRNAPHGDHKRDRKLSKQRPAPDQTTGGIEWLRRF